jgi:AraC family transcriptional regulator, exoenzyme S synthesis regulatory protein ExsA
MDNFYDFISEHPPVKRLRVNDLLLAEYQCPLKDDRFEIWSQHNYYIYVTSGEKKWFNLRQEMHLKPGDCLFVRKGAQSVYQFFNDNFCALVLFVPDSFIRSVLLENQIITAKPEEFTHRESLFPIQCDEQLKAYFQSFYTYLTVPENPNIRLIELKFRELVLLSGTTRTKTLSEYFASLLLSEKPPMREIMEDNFNYPMSLEEYARLCGRSLSAFKREFNEVFGITPGRWLTQKRLELARYLLENTGRSVMETALDSGFNNHSHFSRIFKEKFGMSPFQLSRNMYEEELTRK